MAMEITVAPRHEVGSPVLSVLLPVYNAERYLRQSVCSVLAQTFDNFELLALDDGSTDKSLAILREYELNDSRLRVLSWSQNRGLVPTLNELIANARGRFLARVDADDICFPQRFARQVSFLDLHADHALVGTFCELINNLGQRIGILKHPLDHDEIDRLQLEGRTCVSHTSVLLRRSIISKIGGYDPQFLHAEDLDLWLRLAEYGKIANIPEVLTQYRLHEDSVSEIHGEQQRAAARLASETACRRRGIESRFVKTDHWRSGRDISSRHKFALKYGWLAWNHGHRDTWWTYAKQAMHLKLFSISTWRLLVFGFLKRPKENVSVVAGR
ncbi:MAG TPA: glycosyltransferase [Terriglobales bacterium]|nr:glycosyltransferase [Terriglobales bacterium]